MAPLLLLHRRFRQAPGRRTKSSGSPAATPVLALYEAGGAPLCLVHDSELIGRYAALRRTALGGNGGGAAAGAAGGGAHEAAATAAAAAAAAAAELYGCPLHADPVTGEVAPAASASPEAAAAAYAAVARLEHRLGGAVGVEARRLAYFHGLPAPAFGGQLFVRNASGGAARRTAARLWYVLSRLLLPRLLRINAATAAAGRARLMGELDYLDGLLLAGGGGGGGGSGSGSGGSNNGTTAQRRYLLGTAAPTAADVAAAALAGVLLPASPPLAAAAGVWTPPAEDLPPELRALADGLAVRPTGRLIVAVWEHIAGALSLAGPPQPPVGSKL